jgi:hypothetical protein
MANVSGTWHILQSNTSNVATVNLTQDGEAIFGDAVAGSTVASVGPESRVVGSEFLLELQWNTGSIGEYHGTIGLNGRLTGITVDKTHPGSQATWVSDKFFS